MKRVVRKGGRVRRIQRLRGSQDSYRSLLLNYLKRQGGRKDVFVRDVPKKALDAMFAVPLVKRSGYPLRRAKGSLDPENWKTIEGKTVIVDFSRESWLPDDFTQGLKSTNKLACKKGGSGGTYTVYMNPEGRTFYHKWQVENAMNVKFSITNGWQGLLRQAALTLEQMRLDSDASFFKLLSPHERSCLPKQEELYFAVVSARRTSSEVGLRGIATVQTALTSAGVEPVWYVDKESLRSYHDLGLKAVVGGKLTPARNLALKDARRQGKVCVQCSDDISHWQYHHGENAKDRTLDALNKAHADAYQFVISPVTAARYMLAKMRGAPEETKPKLGGVYCLGHCSRTFASDVISRHHFVIGDFFVDDGSNITFDEDLTLKEDYDFTCSHLNKYGSIMRFNRMTIAARHYSNEGGACSNRDSKGIQERKNIAILKRKWPSAIFDHGTRANEVKLRWKDQIDCSIKEAKTKAKAAKASFKNKAIAKIRNTKAALKAGVKKPFLKLAVKPKASAIKDLQKMKDQQDEIEAKISLLPEAALDDKTEKSFSTLMDDFQKYLLGRGLKETSAKAYVTSFNSLFMRDYRSYEASAGQEYKALIKESPQNKSGHGQFHAAVSHFRSFYQVRKCGQT